MRKLSPPPDALLAAALLVAAEVEVVLDDEGRLVRAVGVALMILPLAWRRRVPLLPVVGAAVGLLLQAWLGDYFAATPAVPLVVIVIVAFCAGRDVTGTRSLAAAAVALAAIAATRIGFDPAVDAAGDAVLTAVAVALPFLAGRWANGQAGLQRELAGKAARIERDRARDARQAAEEERMRIAGDLQAAIAGGLDQVIRDAAVLPGRLAAADHAGARELLAAIATTAREALADVRRVLGILRRDASSPPLAPPAPRDEPPAPDAGSDPRGAETEPDPPAGRRDWGAAGAVWVDRALVAVLLAGAGVEAVATGGGGVAVVAAVAVVVPLLWRRRRPVTVAVAVLAAIAVRSALLDPETFAVFAGAAMVCAAYAVGAHSERRAAIVGLAVVGPGAGAHAAVVHPDAVGIALLAGVAVPWTVGRIVRGQRRLTRERREAALQAERSRAGEARAAVMAERMRVARELHDAVAHNISVIAIQAGGADGIVERDPQRAARCAELIETVAREAREELSRLLDRPDTGPQPSLARVDALARRARAGGLPVDLRIEGEPAALPAGIDLAAYRIVQEALANASKHAAGARAWVVLRYEPRAVEIEVGDDGRARRPARPAGNPNGSGHGLAGIRERVGLYGGTLQVGRLPAGGFSVRARLPIGAA